MNDLSVMLEYEKVWRQNISGLWKVRESQNIFESGKISESWWKPEICSVIVPQILYDATPVLEIWWVSWGFADWDWPRPLQIRQTKRFFDQPVSIRSRLIQNTRPVVIPTILERRRLFGQTVISATDVAGCPTSHRIGQDPHSYKMYDNRRMRIRHGLTGLTALTGLTGLTGLTHVLFSGLVISALAFLISYKCSFVWEIHELGISALAF